ncbi:MAG: RecQ family ATP-dependent DNA helicase [Oscillospiraceae bacterium]|nr:RecQ family ATP-dependent DNA helicase [Oscillospiraceae bacterium]
MDLTEIVFIDVEVGFKNKKIIDIGAITGAGREFHSSSVSAFSAFIRDCKYICGHNMINHDLKYLDKDIIGSGEKFYIDTLYLSPLLFPKKPYHRLVKDDKLAVDEINNPLNDAKKSRDLFFDEEAEYKSLDKRLRRIYFGLLCGAAEFNGFFRYIGDKNPESDIDGLIRERFAGEICENAPISNIIEKHTIETAFALALINVIKHDSLTPPWVIKTYPRVESVLHYLRNQKCQSCAYCEQWLDETKALKRFFHFDGFRRYDGYPLQQDAVKAAISGASILVVFPTGGGKSITFQLPALMASTNEKGLTVVISPLQSLMKDQTDTLEIQHNITDAVTINGSLDPVERAKAFERVENGSASILYISPESLRSKSIELLLLKRNVVRFVIDEAHCFSTWGQDFRVDYMYIGDFMRNLWKKKGLTQSLPVSCFTATAKHKVIEDIRNYFKNKLSLDLEVFRASAARPNLSFHIIHKDDLDEKKVVLRQLLSGADCPTIIYVSITSHAEKLSAMLTAAGFPAKPYHGKMDKRLRVATQNEFMSGEIKIIVATTAFGMGVDKKDIGMVIHYDISDSIENYVQEAGRAGRDENISANCYVLFTDEDLNKRFIMLNQSKITRKEIQQVWKALRNLMASCSYVSRSALEIARAAGWDDSVPEMETRIRTSINALEQSGFVQRGQNMPRIFSDSILVKNMEEAKARIDNSARFDDASRAQAVRIMSSLLSAKSKARARAKSNAKNDDEDGESRVDYMSDRLGIVKADIIRVIGLLREEKILADAKDLVAFIKRGEKSNHSEAIFAAHKNVENFLSRYLYYGEKTYNIKEMNEALEEEYPETSIAQLHTIINYYDIKRFVKRTREYNKNLLTLKPYFPLSEIRAKSGKRHRIAEVIIDYLYSKTIDEPRIKGADDVCVEFSILELKEEFALSIYNEVAETAEIEDALYYLLKIGAMRIDGGFLIIYNAMRIDRLEHSNKAIYSKKHYGQLEEYYKNKRQQIHIIGEYAKRLIDDNQKAMDFMDDYFMMEYEEFLDKYFKGRDKEISLNITPAKYKKLFEELSVSQLRIIKDCESKLIVVAAGPGSGKTKLLTHKLASLYIMEDVRHEQMLMLTFSRAAATEFKKQLVRLIGNAANFIQISTFHSYCFDLLGKVGDLEKSDIIITRAVEKINAGEVDFTRLTKVVLVIDEAQDMNDAEYSLVETLMEKNDDMRVIAVGDDDQNIYEFRGSSPAHFESLLDVHGAKKYELLENYRSSANIVEFANSFATTISHRIKTKPIKPMKKKTGEISICKQVSRNIVTPVVDAVISKQLSGTTCIATRTNEEAFNTVGILLKKGIAAKLIQANDDFSLYNLTEIRDLINSACDTDDNYIISDKVWQKAKSDLSAKYEGSENLPGTVKLIEDFEQTNKEKKYKSDFKQYIRESKLEDFVSGAESSILVSTIHQTKGREFDNVFLAFSGYPKMDDKTRRALYVAITRAKQNLYIYCNCDCFDRINTGNIKRTLDNTNYPTPSLICLQLSHKDVALSFFIARRREIDSIVSGQELLVSEAGCFWGAKQLVRFSAKFCTQMAALKEKGYNPVRAYVRHIVFWQGKDMKKEIKIILPNVEFEKDEEVVL